MVKSESEHKELNNLAKTTNRSNPIESTTMSRIGTIFSSTYHYLTTPAPPALLPPKTNKARIKTNYHDNIVASIALPERPKRKPRACGVAPASSSATLAGSTMLSLFFRPFSSSPKKDTSVIVPRARKPGKEDIDVKMVEFVAQLKAIAEPKDQKIVEELYLSQINLVEHEIIEHAQRRVDLYFYLLVAVYKQGALIEKKSTHKQHGLGTNERGTNACHDSFFPHIKLKYPKSKVAILLSVFVTPWSICGTHFEDSNNMTTELPSMVNTFDTFMELATPGRQSAPSKYVKKCLDDLNLVSKGDITPIDAMNRFLKIMKLFFIEFEKRLHEEGMFEYPNAMRRIWELQYSGTLRAQADESDSIDHAYICSLLRVPPAYVTKTIQDPSLLLTYYCPIIQKEIFTTKSLIGEDRKIIKPH